MIQSTLQIENGGSETTAPDDEIEKESSERLDGADFEQYAVGRESALPEIVGLHKGIRRRDGSTVYVEYDRLTAPAGVKRESPKHGEMACKAIISGVVSYIERYGIEEIEVPKHYTKIDEFEPVVYKWTALGNRIGLGVDCNLLRGLVRTANGKGRIDSEKTRAVACDNDTLVVTGPRGVFFKDMFSIDPKFTDENPPQSAYTNICGFKIPEESEGRIESLRQFVEVVNEYGQHTVAEYEYLRDHGKHIFRAADGGVIYPSSSWLRSRQSTGEILGVHETSTGGEALRVEISEEDLKYEIGEKRPEYLGGVVVGRRFKWQTKEYVYSGGRYSTDATIEYLLLTYPDMYDYHDYAFRTERDTIKSFKS